MDYEPYTSKGYSVVGIFGEPGADELVVDKALYWPNNLLQFIVCIRQLFFCILQKIPSAKGCRFCRWHGWAVPALMN